MTLNRLFFNMQRENIRRQLWCTVVLLVIWFFTFPISCAMTAKRTIAFLYAYCRMFSANSPWLMMVTVCAAVVLAMSCFKHLHSSKMTDCYHALPIKRGMLFATQYLTGLIIFLGTYLLGIVATLVVGLAKGVLVQYMMPNLFYGYFYMALVFLMLYTITIIAVELTGKLLTGVLGTAYLSGYTLVVYTLVRFLQEMYYDTFNYRSVADIEDVTEWISPISRLIKNAEDWLDIRPADCVFRINGIMDSRPQTLGEVEGTTLVVTMLPAGVVLGMLFGIVLLIAVAVVLFICRRSESAGNSMAFEKSRPFVKFMTVIPMGVLFGVFFQNISYYQNFAWLMFGAVCGAILTGCAIEVIFQTDIRAIFRKKWETLIGVVATIVCICFFCFDWSGYDSYLPKKEDLKGVSFAFAFDWGEANRDLTNPTLPYDDEYMHEKAIYENVDAIYPLLEYVTDDDAEVIGGHHTSMEVGYHLANGKVEYRSYDIVLSDKKMQELINTVFVTEEYKQLHHVIYHDEVMDYMVGITLSGHKTGSIATCLNQEKTREFLEIYRQEYTEQSLYDFMTEDTVYSVDFLINAPKQMNLEEDIAYVAITSEEKSYAYTNSIEYPVYAGFTKTLAWLEKNLPLEEEKDFYKKIEHMTVWNIYDGSTYNFYRGIDDEVIRQIFENMTVWSRFSADKDYKYRIEYFAQWYVKDQSGQQIQEGRYFEGYLSDEHAGLLVQ